MYNPYSNQPHRSTPPDALSETQLLNELLRYCEEAPQEKAEALLSKHGNWANILDVYSSNPAPDQILSAEGVNLIRLVAELYRRYLLIRSHGNVHLLDRNAIIEFLVPLFANATEETIYLISLDESKRLLGYSRLSSGEVNSVHLPIRTLVREALSKQASNVILAHNHPSGLMSPSREDIQTTLALKDLLMPLDIRLLDHIIFTEAGYCSLVESGIYHP